MYVLMVYLFIFTRIIYQFLDSSELYKIGNFRTTEEEIKGCPKLYEAIKTVDNNMQKKRCEMTTLKDTVNLLLYIFISARHLTIKKIK